MEEDPSVSAARRAIVARLCSIPADVRRGGGSFFDLVARSGFCAVREDLRPEEIAAHLRTEPSLVEDWLAWSEDKRSDGPWFRRGEGAYEVGAPGARRRFDDPFEACAAFILLEAASR